MLYRRQTLKFVLTLASLAVGISAGATPAEVLIIRHGEKNVTAQGKDDGRDLSARGYARANALAGLFTQDARMLEFGKPVAIYAGAPKKEDTGSIRPFETIQPTAKSLGLTPITDYISEDSDSMVDKVMKKKAYEGKTVLISWPHDQIPDMAKSFGVKKKKVPDWKGSIFDRVWRIKFDDHGDVASFDNLPQHLLPGDSTD